MINKTQLNPHSNGDNLEIEYNAWMEFFNLYHMKFSFAKCDKYDKSCILYLYSICKSWNTWEKFWWRRCYTCKNGFIRHLKEKSVWNCSEWPQVEAGQKASIALLCWHKKWEGISVQQMNILNIKTKRLGHSQNFKSHKLHWNLPANIRLKMYAKPVFRICNKHVINSS